MTKYYFDIPWAKDNYKSPFIFPNNPSIRFKPVLTLYGIVN